MRRMLERTGEATGSEQVFKSFGALSFNAGGVTGANAPALGAARPRPTPESVSDFNVHTDGLAAAISHSRLSPGGRQGTKFKPGEERLSDTITAKR
jgi:hypothetical protein